MNHRVHEVYGDRSLSPLRRYALLAVGSPRVGALILYELVVLLCGAVPGVLGYGLRRHAYRLILGGMGRRVTIGRNVTIRGGKKITLGDDVFIDDQCVLDARGDSEICIEAGVLVARHSIVRARDGRVRLKAGCDIGCNCILGTDSTLEMGREVLVAAYTYVVAGGNHRIDDGEAPIIRQGTESRGGVRIGDGAWLGARVTVLDGVTIGEGAVIGAHGLVSRDIPAMTVARGVPAKVVRERSRGTTDAGPADRS